MPSAGGAPLSLVARTPAEQQLPVRLASNGARPCMRSVLALFTTLALTLTLTPTLTLALTLTLTLTLTRSVLALFTAESYPAAPSGLEPLLAGWHEQL